MRSLLLIAHGSRRPASNAEVSDLVDALRANIDTSIYQEVRLAFLELADPNIADSIAASVTAGVTEIQVLPYFLSAGRHVSEHIPIFIDAAVIKYPEVTIDLLSHFGAMPQLATLLTELLNST